MTTRRFFHFVRACIPHPRSMRCALLVLGLLVQTSQTMRCVAEDIHVTLPSTDSVRARYGRQEFDDWVETTPLQEKELAVYLDRTSTKKDHVNVSLAQRSSVKGDGEILTSQELSGKELGRIGHFVETALRTELPQGSRIVSFCIKKDIYLIGLDAHAISGLYWIDADQERVTKVSGVYGIMKILVKGQDVLVFGGIDNGVAILLKNNDVTKAPTVISETILPSRILAANWDGEKCFIAVCQTALYRWSDRYPPQVVFGTIGITDDKASSCYPWPPERVESVFRIGTDYVIGVGFGAILLRYEQVLCVFHEYWLLPPESFEIIAEIRGVRRLQKLVVRP